MIFQQLFEPRSCTYSYLVASSQSRQALLIDPVAGELAKYVQLLQQHELSLCYSLETHVHADHVTAAHALREQFGCKTVLHPAAKVQCADLYLSHGSVLRLGELWLELRHTPGHTPACCSFLLGNRLMTGDCLLIDGCGRTDFQHGDAATLYDSIHQQIFSLPDETLIYPGHDYQGRQYSSVGQERQWNARLGQGRSKADFVALMAALRLPYPQQMAVAVPANQRCGQS
jgi:glyoxylase-like metal-dependent hydrolase (beta-lactamase superfamily II)